MSESVIAFLWLVCGLLLGGVGASFFLQREIRRAIESAEKAQVSWERAAAEWDRIARAEGEIIEARKRLQSRYDNLVGYHNARTAMLKDAISNIQEANPAAKGGSE